MFILGPAPATVIGRLLLQPDCPARDKHLNRPGQHLREGEEGYAEIIRTSMYTFCAGWRSFLVKGVTRANLLVGDAMPLRAGITPVDNRGIRWVNGGRLRRC